MYLHVIGFELVFQFVGDISHWHVSMRSFPFFSFLERASIQPKRVCAGRVKKAIGYFNNPFHGYAPENALYFIERLGVLSEEQKKAKQRASEKQSQL